MRKNQHVNAHLQASWNTYGEDSFDVIENHPDWLVEIKGISRKKAYEISLDFKEKSDIREILTFCNGTISSNEFFTVSLFTIPTTRIATAKITGKSYLWWDPS